MKIKQILQALWSKLTGEPIAEELGFMCCFCNKSITSLDPDPSDINIIANIDKPKDQQADQYFYCHLQCLKNKVHPNIKEHFVLDDVSKQIKR
jgi:hypothetical protein